MDFSKFDKNVDIEGLKKDVKEAEKNQPSGEYEEVPKGTYEAEIKLDVKMTKNEPHRPMVCVDAKILEGKFTKHHLFMNRVIYGTKNDANMIQSIVGWLKKLGTDIEIEFEGYGPFADLVMDVAEAIDGKFEYLIDWDPKAFNSISIKEVFEVE